MIENAVQNIIDQYVMLVFSVFDATPNEVRAAIDRDHEEKGKNAGYSWARAHAGIEAAYVGEPQAGGRDPARMVFYEPRSHPGFTVGVPNLSDGWQTLINCISKQARTPIWSFRLCRSTMEFPVNGFTHHRHGEEQRIVQALHDFDRWDWFVSGEALPEEDSASYEHRRAADRFNWDRGIALARALGFPVEEDSFWTPREGAWCLTEVRETHE